MAQNIVGSFITGVEAGRAKRMSGLQEAQYAEEAPLRAKERLVGLQLKEAQLQHQQTMAPYQLKQAQAQQKMSMAQFDEFMDKRNLTNAAITAAEFKTISPDKRQGWLEQKISDSARKGNNTLTRQLIEMRGMSPEEQERAADSTMAIAQRFGLMGAEPAEKPPRVSLTAGEYLVDGNPRTLKVSDRGFVDAVTGELIPQGSDVRKVRVGTRTRIDPKTGEVIIEEGVQLDGKKGVTPAVRTEAQKKILQTTESLGQIKSIEDLYKPDYLEWATQAGQLWGKVKEKAGIELSKEEKQFKGQFTRFKRNTFDLLNKYLKNQSGVAISPKEAERLKQSMPTMGDSPTEFLAKVDELKTDLERTRLIYSMALKESGREKGTPDVNKRADEFAANPDADVMGEYILSINPQWQNLPVDQQEENVVGELIRLGFING